MSSLVIVKAYRPNKALQPTPSRFAGWGCSVPLLAAHLRVGLIARSGWLSLTFDPKALEHVLRLIYSLVMATVEDIESAVTRLPEAEYSKFRNWIFEYDNDLWDKQMVRDAEAGRFDDLAAEAIADFKAGRCTDL